MHNIWSAKHYVPGDVNTRFTQLDIDLVLTQFRIEFSRLWNSEFIERSEKLLKRRSWNKPGFTLREKRYLRSFKGDYWSPKIQVFKYLKHEKSSTRNKINISDIVPRTLCPKVV